MWRRNDGVDGGQIDVRQMMDRWINVDVASGTKGRRRQVDHLLEEREVEDQLEGRHNQLVTDSANFE